jgi:hypothetical protein
VATGARTAGLVVEERTTYGNGRGYTVLPGLTTLSVDAYLLHPGAGGGDDIVMAFNPNRRPVVLSLAPLASPQARTRRVTVPALGQLAVRLRTGDVGMDVALHLRSSAPIAMSYEGLLPAIGESTLAKTYRGSVIGNLTAPARIHVFAEGDTRQMSSNPRETLYLANTNALETRITIHMLSTRSRVTSLFLTLAPAGSLAIDLNDWYPPGQHGLIVVSTLPILVSRTIDFNESADRLLSSGLTG